MHNGLRGDRGVRCRSVNCGLLVVVTPGPVLVLLVVIALRPFPMVSMRVLLPARVIRAFIVTPDKRDTAMVALVVIAVVITTRDHCRRRNGAHNHQSAEHPESRSHGSVS